MPSEDHGHSHHHDDDGHGHHFRLASGRALRISLLVLSLFFLIELVGGILSQSLALISDAGHLLTDVASLAMALLAQWAAQRKPSSKHSYGYMRLEILAALLNGATLWGVALYIFIEAYFRILTPPSVQALPMVVIGTLGLVAQVLVTMILRKASEESLNVKGAYIHVLTDAVQSVGVVIGGLVIYFTGYTIIDPIISVVIGVLIIYSGSRVIFEAAHVLIEGTPKEIDLDHLAQRLLEQKGVYCVTDLHAWTLTTGYNALSAHVVSMPGMDAQQREELREKLAAMLKRDYPLQHITLQVEEKCGDGHNGSCCRWLESKIADEEDHQAYSEGRLTSIEEN